MARRKTKDVADQRPGRPNPEDPKIEFNSQRWWKMRGREAAGALWNWSDTRRAYLRGYHALDLIHEAIYEGRPVGRHIGSAAMDFLRAQSQASSYLNVLQSMVDTVVSRQGRRRPSLTVLVTLLRRFPRACPQALALQIGTGQPPAVNGRE